MPGATPNTANCDKVVGGYPGDLTDAGSYTSSISPNGTFDQGGNVWEWNEVIIGSNRGRRGGDFFAVSSNLAASSRDDAGPAGGYNNTGFRVASIPEPGTGLLVMAGLLGLGAWRRLRA